ncbi:molecular chaperone DnaJ [Wolbachia endosymbiont of Cylisticus convexus]|uniref:molecular chaperone DnaJ n=1 Tax=Wolbachia endosymbiont of Cylisticus convexus TaxID=118728 RepID=UPI000DF6BD6A|nr:molecular chaperone DnaJ [Wolbachia endosymbiont of Cylisticus convexus]RDD33609.1 molecular chaperone DnaJ [Wolbachia endosymbiont of Cylisticus convexus]RDD35238.1 molecular chaperone DnaJ [Wolbachia endosymbiont of Cylisticus convexus]
MGYKLRKREYDYNESLFKELGIETQEVEGRNFLEISNIIAKNYRRLSIKCHPDKSGGSDEKIQALNRNKAALLQYIKSPNKKNRGLIIPEETRRCLQLIKQRQNNKYTKYYVVFSLVRFLLYISLLVSYIYLGFKLYKAANFTDAPGILFSASLITSVTIFFLSVYLIASVVKEDLDLQNSQREQGENLDQEERWEEILKSKRFKYLIFIAQYSSYLPPILLIAGLVLQYQSSCLNSKILIGSTAVLGCILLLQLASEIYERKVVNLVKTEGRGDEQNVPIGALTGKPSSIVNPDGAFNVSAHQVG